MPTTGGSDLAEGGFNESLDWRPVGTTGVTNPGAFAVSVTASAPVTHAPADAQGLLTGLATSVRGVDGVAEPIVAVTVNGTPVDALDATGEFFAGVTLSPGENTYTFTATSESGLTGSTSITLTGATTPAGRLDLSQFADLTATFRGGNSDILLRRTIRLPAGTTNFQVRVAIDNDIQVFLNGQDISGGLVTSEGRAERNRFTFHAPDRSSGPATTCWPCGPATGA